MKTTLSVLGFVFVLGALMNCQETLPLTPKNPVVGTWILNYSRDYHVPLWFVKKTNESYIVTSPDTIFGGPSPIVFDVNSLTFTAGGEFSEFYFSNPGKRDTTLLPKIDTGQWTLADSVVQLTVANSFPHKLTYRYATDELVTDVHPKTISQEFLDGSVGTISYSTQIGYRRAP